RTGGFFAGFRSSQHSPLGPHGVHALVALAAAVAGVSISGTSDASPSSSGPGVVGAPSAAVFGAASLSPNPTEAATLAAGALGSEVTAAGNAKPPSATATPNASAEAMKPLPRRGEKSGSAGVLITVAGTVDDGGLSTSAVRTDGGAMLYASSAPTMGRDERGGSDDGGSNASTRLSASAMAARRAASSAPEMCSTNVAISRGSAR